MNVIDQEVEKFLHKIHAPTSPKKENDKISIFYENQMSSHYKMEEKQLKGIINQYVKPVDANKTLNLVIYYKNRKLKNLLIKNKNTQQKQVSQESSVVYQYTCNKEGCNSSSYIGYTMCTVSERFRMHTQKSSIKKHLTEQHGIAKVPRKELLESTTILRRCNKKRTLIMTEAILIKEKKPVINSQQEGCDRLLKIFKH